ncbi:hypothetical protein SAMN04488564_101538 [Lentzea waywayandensis]|uniref:Excreted virulence factor EspC, type VII ESX diderm n=1 Tax=Lentzea waywayandensis TaxID=84724 RepID=A0A1I6CXM8_9PSEU|nr:hypothetical protein [Lentzea waywayandensis]SFQ97920.1 hypothetical protein SAMN04488564_101538 [Lentzea waywayandensis]
MNHASDEAEMKAHLGKLDDIGARINTAVTSANATMDATAFGLLGMPLAGICAGASALAANAIEKASDSAVAHYREFADMALHIKSNEQAQATNLDGTHRK